MLARKKFLLFVLVTLLSAFSFVGCGESGKSISKAESASNSQNSLNVESADSASDLTGNLKVSFLDVGQGDSIFIELPNNQTMLIDAGNPDDAAKVSAFIRDEGYAKIDYVVATHPHDDHIGGLPKIIRDFDISFIYMPKVSNNTISFENLLKEIKQKDYQIDSAKAGVNILKEENLSIDIIAPVNSSYEDLNNYSAVIRLDYGTTSFLFMGDAEKLSENQIKADIDVDVLKVGHHGSDYSSSPSFIQKVSPEYAVISVGKGNDYGHPASKTLDTLIANNATTYRTDELGTIVFESDGSKITVNNVASKPFILQKSPVISAYNVNTIVYITDTGSKYHRSGCKYLSESKIPISLSEAVIHHNPCSVCDPPVVDDVLAPPTVDNPQ